MAKTEWNPELILDALAHDLVKSEERKDRLKNASDPDKAELLRLSMFREQDLLIQDKAKLQSILAPRRSGKSQGLVMSDVYECMRRPGFQSLYVGLSKPHCKEIYWPILEELNDKFDLKLEFKLAELKVIFPNKSTISLFGAETYQDIAKLKGRKFHRVTVDECQDHGENILNSLIKFVKPALSDFSGILRLAGTPGYALQGVWYSSSRPDPQYRESEQGAPVLENWNYNPEEQPVARYLWSRHHWTAKHNTAAPHIWNEHLETKQLMGWNDANETWRREYLAEWVAMTDILVYAVRRHAHTYGGPYPWEDDRIGRCNFVLGADFGFRDGTAIVVWCYVEDEPYLYEFTSLKVTEKTQDDLVTIFRSVELAIPKTIAFRVGDPGGGGLLLMEGFKATHGMAFEVAEKDRKLDHIELFNAALDMNLIRFRPGSPLLDEMEVLRWKERATHQTERARKVEDPSQPNDLCLVAGTKVLTECGEVPIELIPTGMLVHTRGGLKKVLCSFMSSPAEETWELVTESGHVLRGTGNHPVMTGDGWVPLEQCGLHKFVYTTAVGEDPSESAIESVRRTGLVEPVYNLTVEDTPEFFANSVLVHNCDAALYSFRKARLRPVAPKPVPVKKLSLDEQMKADYASRRSRAYWWEKEF